MMLRMEVVMHALWRCTYDDDAFFWPLKPCRWWWWWWWWILWSWWWQACIWLWWIWRIFDDCVDDAYNRLMVNRTMHKWWSWYWCIEDVLMMHRKCRRKSWWWWFKSAVGHDDAYMMMMMIPTIIYGNDDDDDDAYMMTMNTHTWSWWWWCISDSDKGCPQQCPRLRSPSDFNTSLTRSVLQGLPVPRFIEIVCVTPQARGPKWLQ